MGLLSSLFSRSRSADGVAVDQDPVDSLTQARTRARQRLIGAVVLVGIGVIGFPLLFETQPRPIPVDVPIEIPRKDNLPPLKLPTARAPVGATPAAVTPDPGSNAQRSKPGSDVITETAAEAGIDPKAAKPTPGPRSAAAKVEPRSEPAAAAASEARADARPTAKPEPKAESKAEAKAEPRPDSKPATRPEIRPAPPAGDDGRAQAILEARAPGAATAGTAAQRYIVQIGAFADPALARETRLKVERLGMVTYTHVAQTPGGARTRVRVGPVPTREEAAKLAARLKAAGLPAAILTL